MSGQFTSGFITAMLMTVLVFIIFYRRCSSEKKWFLQTQNDFVHIEENSKDFIYYYAVYPKRQFKYLSPSAENLLGEGAIERAYLNPDSPFIDVHPDDYEILQKKVEGKADYSQSMIQRWKDQNGRYRWYEEHATPIYENGRFVAIQGVIRNIDEKIELQKNWEHRMNHDILTGIYNRAYFEMISAKFNEKADTSAAIILCDLDELKMTNDRYGHKKGDALIKEAAILLKGFSSESITVARIGGDEFVLLAAGQTEEEVTQLKANISNEIMARGIKLSMGYAYSESSIGKMADLFSLADKRMYKNKAERKQEKHLVR